MSLTLRSRSQAHVYFQDHKDQQLLESSETDLLLSNYMINEM